MVIVEIDGNDGTGKSFIIEMLKKYYDKDLTDIIFKDRGALTKATDSGIFVEESNTIYILLDCSIEKSQERIKFRGDSLDEKYHTISDLKYYRERFLLLAREYDIPIFSTDMDNFERNLNNIFNYIKQKQHEFNYRH